jgi:hypothetical protein
MIFTTARVFTTSRGFIVLEMVKGWAGMPVSFACLREESPW